MIRSGNRWWKRLTKVKFVLAVFASIKQCARTDLIIQKRISRRIMTNVLYISYDGMTDPLGQSQVLPYLRGLANEYAITILSCEKAVRFAANEPTIRQICSEAGIQWQPIPYTKWPPILSTMKDLHALNKQANELHRQREFKIVHCRSYISSLVGLRMKQRFGTKFIFDMRGFWADERIDGGLWSLRNPVQRAVYNFFKTKEKAFLENADAIVTLTEASRDEICRWYSDRQLPLKVIPCCADFDHFDYRRLNQSCLNDMRHELDIPLSATVFSYLGSVGTWYMTAEMFEFFGQIRREIPNAHLLFITNDNVERVTSEAVTCGIPAESFTATSMSRNKVPIGIACSDINLFFIKPAYSKMASSPTKLAEVLAMGKPVICNSGVGDLDRLFADRELGISVDVEDKSTWDEAVRGCQQLLQSDPMRIRQKSEEMFSLVRGVGSYRAIYQSVMKAYSK